MGFLENYRFKIQSNMLFLF